MGGSCSDGIYTVSSGGDRTGTVYFNSSGEGVYKTTLGHATFFFPQYTVQPSRDFGGNQTFIGMSFDSTNANDTRNVQVTANAAGTIFTVNPLSSPGNGTIDPTYTDTISISEVNAPQNGMLVGMVTRTTLTGTGGGSGNIACIVNNSPTLSSLEVICSGQSPSSSTTPYNITFTHPPVLESIEITPSVANLYYNETTYASAVGVLSNGTTQALTGTIDWSTSNPSEITVDASGNLVVVGNSSGSATITASDGAGIGTVSISDLGIDTYPSMVGSPFPLASSQVSGLSGGTFGGALTTDFEAVSQTWTSSALVPLYN